MLNFTKSSITMTSILCGDFPKAEVFVPCHSPYWVFDKNELNSHGYRCDDFKKKARLKIVSIGCSDVFGWGIQKSERFSDVLASYYNEDTCNWNLGLPSSSNDWINLMTLQSLRLLQPSVVIVCFTRIIRKIHFDDAKCLNYLPYNKPKNAINCLYGKENNGWAMKAFDHLDSLVNYDNDIFRFYLNYKAVQNACDSAGVPFLFTLSLNTYGKFVGLEDILKFVDHDRYVGYFEVLDLSSDESHPGPESNRRIANLLYERLKDI